MNRTGHNEKQKMAGSLVRSVNSPTPVLRDPRKLFWSMWSDLLASRELAWLLLQRNLRARYRQTALGYIWAFLPPIAMTLVWVVLRSANVVSMEPTKTPYVVYVFVGTVLWQIFVEAIDSPIRLVTASKQMLSRVNFPREALILAGAGEVVFGSLIRFLLVIPVLLWYRVSIESTILLVPVGVFALICFGIMVGLFLTPLAALFQDIHFGFATVTTFWFFLTPVVYPLPTDGLAKRLIGLNLVSPLIVQTREWCTSGGTSSLGPFVIATTVTVVLILAAWLLYRVAMPHVIARIGA